ncbi:PilW family protein [Thiocapsa bogorovii]|uniref:PilW family protein n=1 Tax=Thiocapsa bogorovii TaxID=521689 RepID=UPI001E44FF83|nr:PilW family protein [Thiocapsa bogorovii]UHD16156.1 PilW family protein [Thiocapsa bogorovii]
MFSITSPHVAALQQPIPRPARARGFTIIELMIAMTIGLFLLGGLALVLSNNSRTRYELQKSIGQIQNARYALQTLADDLSNTGFYGEAGIPNTSGWLLLCLDLPNNGLPLTCPNEVCMKLERAFPIQGSDDIANRPNGCSAMDDVRTGNDVVVVRRASTCDIDEDQCDAFQDGALHIQQPACIAGAQPIVATSTAAFAGGMTRVCDPNVLAPIYRLLNHVYYVARNNRPNDGIPTLKRAELAADGYIITPIAEGIEHLQIEYGVDADENGDPDLYSQAGTLHWDDWRNVVAVRIHLIARNVLPTDGYEDERTYRLGSEGEFGPFQDSFKRQAYSKTVRLNNIAGPRETN